LVNTIRKSVFGYCTT